jgi:hypothetical protein
MPVTPSGDFVIEVERCREAQGTRNVHAGSIGPMAAGITSVGNSA